MTYQVFLPGALLYGSGWKTWWPGMFLCATKWIKYNCFSTIFPYFALLKEKYICAAKHWSVYHILILHAFKYYLSNNIFKIKSLSVFQQHSNVNVIWNSSMIRSLLKVIFKTFKMCALCTIVISLSFKLFLDFILIFLQ